jgi:hypothetical protein
MCNCKKKKSEPTVIVATPEPIKIPQPPIQEDWYNNIDTIEPIKKQED